MQGHENIFSTHGWQEKYKAKFWCGPNSEGQRHCENKIEETFIELS